MERLPDVSIIGLGALGSCLAKAFHINGIEIRSLFDHHPENVEELSEALELSSVGRFPDKAEELGKLVFITVPDDVIGEVAEKLSSLSGKLDKFTFVHCSGNKPAQILHLLRKRGARVASFHPLQTFTSSSTPKDFENIYFDIEGDREAVDLLGEVTGRLDAQWFEVSAEAKSFLHASAVVASNYLLVLLKMAGDIATSGGMEEQEIRKALFPLAQQSLKNTKSDDLSKMLTGPIARGDIQTVRKHIELLEPHSPMLVLYKLLGYEALKLADEKGNLSPDKLNSLQQLLETDE